jgi:hypothetical protein
MTCNHGHAGLPDQGKARDAMSFCEHCEGQRFDRAQVLRVLRATRKTLQKHSRADEALCQAIKSVRALEIPHMERLDDSVDEQTVH